jgi:hypothetical protein
MNNVTNSHNTPLSISHVPTTEKRSITFMETDLASDQTGFERSGTISACHVEWGLTPRIM